MKNKIFFILLSVLFHFVSYSQLLKTTDVTFLNFKGYSAVGNNLKGELIKSGEAITKNSISNININTFIALETTIIGGGEQVYIVSNINKKIIQNKIVCNIECRNGQDPDRKIVKFIFEYVDDMLTTFYWPAKGGIIEFY